MTLSTPIAEPGGGIGYRARVRLPHRLARSRAGPVAAVLLGVLVLWYAGAVFLNWPTEAARLARAAPDVGAVEVLKATLSAQRPLLPAPHQVAVEIWNTTAMVSPGVPRSLVFHAGVTLGPTLLGFALGSLFGVAIAVGILFSRTLDKSLMPWVIASQTIPILAIAPTIIVALSSQGITGLVPKAIISTYLSFFPVAVGMVKGLRSPDAIQLDLLRTYDASALQTLAKLRAPASLPFLFASMKVAVAAALVGAIVGELPTGAQAGLGARLLSGSYYGQTIQIWSALAAASILAGCLVGLVGLAETLARRITGARPA